MKISTERLLGKETKGCAKGNWMGLSSETTMKSSLSWIHIHD